MTFDSSPDSPFTVIAIDGGAASGKSSTSRRIAALRNFLHVDTGAHYRAVAWACLEAGVAPRDDAEMQAFLGKLDLRTRVDDRESLVCFGDNPPLDPRCLRSREVNNTVSLYAAVPSVREAVKAYQRDQVRLAREQGFRGIIMDGRDIGTVILHDADLKVFLVADPSQRQRRRELEGTQDTIASRDEVDSSRKTAPLRPAEDALVIDNSDIGLDEVVGRILEEIERLP